MMDPLVGAVCNPPEIWQMVDEMLVAQAAWLPQYKRAIKAAQKRLAKGGLIKTRVTQGAARVKVKTVKEMQRDAKNVRAMVAASEKAGLDKKSLRRSA